MTTTRDLIRSESNERVDLGDYTDVQWTMRSATHLPWRWFINNLTNVTPKAILQGFAVTASGSPDSLVHVANGLGIGGITLPDGTVQHGVFFGQEGPSTQALDFTGQPNDTYQVMVRPSLDSSTPGSRIVWNDNTAEEEADSFDTRYEFGWDVTFATVSPGNEWQTVAQIVWGGSTIATGNITQRQYLLFEGDSSLSFVSSWGAGNDRNTDRATYGVADFTRWNSAVRKQLTDIIGESHWYDAPNTSLAAAALHIADVTDPHSDSPTWTGEVTVNDLVIGGTINGDVDIDGAVTIADDLTLDTGQYGWVGVRIVQTEIPLMALVAAHAGGFISVSGTWTGHAGGVSVTGMEGEPARSPQMTLTVAAPTDRIDFDIGPWVKGGCVVYGLRVIAEVDADSMDVIATLSTCPTIDSGGTSTTYSTLDSDTQNIGNGGRKEVSFDLSGATFHGWLATGKFFYNLSFEVQTVNGAAARLNITKIILLQSGDKVLKTIGSASI